MKNTEIFTRQFEAGSSRKYKTDLGNGSQICIGDVGFVLGLASRFKAVVLTGYTETENWYLVNLTNSNRIFLETIAVLGALSEEHAIDAALATFNTDFGGVAQASDVIDSVPAFVLKRLLDHQDRARFKGRVTYSEINNLREQVTGRPVVWRDQNSTELSSHSNIPALMSDISMYDCANEILEKADTEELISGFLNGSEQAQYDSIVSQVSRLDGLSNRIMTALNNAADKVKPVSVTKTDPFKKNGVVNIAQVFDMDDGQKVSIIYHNPDATPSKLTPTDVLTSWKFLLNKHDVSAVLQPKSNKDVNIPNLAKRMLKLVEANSARFKRTQERKIKAEAELQEMIALKSEKITQIESLDNQISEIQAQLDIPIEQHVTPENKSDYKNDQDGDILNKQGEQFLLRSTAQRMITSENLEGYVPKKKGKGYVLHKLNDAHYQRKGTVLVGNPKYSERVLEGEPRLVFEKFNRTFVVSELMGGGVQRFEVIDMLNHITLSAMKDGEPVFFFKSVMDAYKEIDNSLSTMGLSDFEKTSFFNTTEFDAEQAEKISNGEEKQPIEVIEEKQKEAQQSKKDELKAKLDAKRDENGKLNLFSDDAMERVQAMSELSFDEELDAQAGLLEMFNNNAKKEMTQAEFDAEVISRKEHVLNRYARNEQSSDYIRANKMLYEQVKNRLNALENEPESTAYKAANMTLDRIKSTLERAGEVVGASIPADAETTQGASPAEQFKHDQMKGIISTLKSAAEDGVPKNKRTNQAVIEIAKGFAKRQPFLADEIMSELQYVLNNNPQLRMYQVIMPRHDKVTQGKTANKLRRLNKALKESNTPFSITGNESKGLIINTASNQFKSTRITYASFMDKPFNATADERQDAQDYEPLLDAILQYLNEEKAIESKSVYFGRDQNIIDSSSNQLSHELKQDFQEIGASSKSNNQNTGAGQAVDMALNAAQTLDPSLAAASEVNDVTGTITPEVNQKAQPEPTMSNDPVLNDDEKWLDQIIAGELDLAGLDMGEFGKIATKYAEDTSTQIYAKLEQALNAITNAKIAKAKAV